MISLRNKKSIIGTIAALSLAVMIGCSSTTKPLGSNTNNNNQGSSISNDSKAPTNDSSSSNDVVTTVPSNSSQQTLLESIKKLAEQGKIINSDFSVKSTALEDIEKKLGKANKLDWVPLAKGTYATYSKYNVVFGFNKGSQIFEVRSFDSRLAEISLSMVKKAFGTPAYDVKSNGEEIIGYTAGPEFKILFVFPQPTTGKSDPILNHYSVFYPKGTVNSMADDPGRQW